jgi:hypothetical protein
LGDTGSSEAIGDGIGATGRGVGGTRGRGVDRTGDGVELGLIEMGAGAVGGGPLGGSSSFGEGVSFLKRVGEEEGRVPGRGGFDGSGAAVNGNKEEGGFVSSGCTYHRQTKERHHH